MNNNITQSLNKISCIYQIRNLVDNKIYIGSTNNLMYRNNYHTNHLDKGDHFNQHLQRAWNKHGRSNFTLEVLLLCDQTMLFWYEQQFLDIWNPEYNISKHAQVPTMRGEKLNRERVEKARKSNLGKKRSEQARKNMSLGQTGKKYSDETKKLWSLQRKGRVINAKFHSGLVSPSGEIYKNIYNMSKFCREHCLSKSKISAVELGKASHTHGWTLYAQQ